MTSSRHALASLTSVIIGESLALIVRSMENTMRDGGNTALKTVYIAHTAYIASIAHTVNAVFTNLDENGYYACKTQCKINFTFIKFYLKVQKIATKVVSRQNCVSNFTLCVKLKGNFFAFQLEKNYT